MTGHAAILLAPRESFLPLAREQAMAYLCPEGGCGACRVCHLIQAGDHPDVLYLSPDGTSIKIGQVRGLLEELAVKPYMGERRLVVILSADLMTEQAQNALLKTIEEPAPGCGFLLLAESREKLLPTIRSRCGTIRRDGGRIEQGLCLAARVMGRDEGEAALWQRDMEEKGPLYTAWEDGKKALYLGFSQKYSMMEEVLSESKADGETLLDCMASQAAHLLLVKAGTQPLDPQMEELFRVFPGDGYIAARIVERIQTAGRMHSAHVGKRGYLQWLSLAVMEELDEDRSRCKI
ncbi:hypothetical protein KP626_06895 [Christensenella sp. MSJ-20]|uniref:hypothetical protein n=1 Tax=Christensenella sp. MSJ-20 TaxID=2841518 RepID=UPI001C78F3FF|nr:hypothetical protein KP626_06895 [Christensenella sp. MSJ-20]